MSRPVSAGPNRKVLSTMNDIAPRFTIEGTAHRVSKKTLPASDDASQPARTVANVVVLTSGGGFAEVYIDEANLAACPVQGDDVCWLVDVNVWNRTSQSGNRFGVLRVRFVESRVAA